MGPDFAHREFGPTGDVVDRWGFSLALEDLLPREQLLHEDQGAVALSWQEDALQNSWDEWKGYLLTSLRGKCRGFLWSGSAG